MFHLPLLSSSATTLLLGPPPRGSGMSNYSSWGPITFFFAKALQASFSVVNEMRVSQSHSGKIITATPLIVHDAISPPLLEINTIINTSLSRAGGLSGGGKAKPSFPLCIHAHRPSKNIHNESELTHVLFFTPEIRVLISSKNGTTSDVASIPYPCMYGVFGPPFPLDLSPWPQGEGWKEEEEEGGGGGESRTWMLAGNLRLFSYLS